MLISVFTPTYNRAHTIHRVWDSLCQQTDVNFEWIVVDDGSSDDIDQLMAHYQSLADFTVKYEKLERNMGKHRAIARGVELAAGTLFVIADSDDSFKPETVAFFRNAWQKLPDPSKFSGIRVAVEDQTGRRISSPVPGAYLDASMQAAYYLHGIRQESWSADRTDLLRKYSFPPNHQGTFPEGIMWKAISRKHPIRFFDTVLRVYYIEPGSLQRTKRHYQQKIDRSLAGAGDVLNNDMNYFWKLPVFFLKKAIIYGHYAFLSQRSYLAFQDLSPAAKGLVGVTAPLWLPLAIITFLKDGKQ